MRCTARKGIRVFAVPTCGPHLVPLAARISSSSVILSGRHPTRPYNAVVVWDVVPVVVALRVGEVEVVAVVVADVVPVAEGVVVVGVVDVGVVDVVWDVVPVVVGVVEVVCEVVGVLVIEVVAVVISHSANVPTPITYTRGSGCAQACKVWACNHLRVPPSDLLLCTQTYRNVRVCNRCGHNGCTHFSWQPSTQRDRPTLQLSPHAGI